VVVIFIVGYLLRVYAVELSFVECGFGVFVFSYVVLSSSGKPFDYIRRL